MKAPSNENLLQKNQCTKHVGYNCVAIFIRLAVVASQICEIPRNSTNIWTYSSLRSSKVMDIGVNWKRMCNFLLLINSNYGRISWRICDINDLFAPFINLLPYLLTNLLTDRFQDIDALSSKIACVFFHRTVAWRPLWVECLAIST